MTQHYAPRGATYRRPVSRWWWLEKRSYLLFVLREFSCVFVAWTVVFMLVMLGAVAGGDDDYQSFLDWASAPWVVVVNVISLLFLALHTVTWFALTPKAMVVRVRGERMPAWLILAGQYAGLVVVSAFVIWLVAR
jgi:fumarate reductase subunit C